MSRAPTKSAAELNDECSFEEAQDKCSELRTHLQAALDALDQAESCETVADCAANLRDVRDECEEVTREVTEMLP